MKFEKFVIFLWYAFVVVVPWQTVWLVREVFVGGEKWQYGTIGIYLSDILLVVFLSLVIWQNWRQIWQDILRRTSGRNLVLTLSTVAFVDYVFLSAFWADDWLLALYYGMKILLMFALVYLMRFACQKSAQAQISVLRTVGVLVASLTVGALIGIWQFVSQSSFASVLLGMSAYDAATGGVSVVESAGRWLRAYGPQAHPNIFGMLCAVGAVLSAQFALARNQTIRIFFVASGIILTAGVMVSFSRSALIVLIFGLLALGAVASLRKLQFAQNSEFITNRIFRMKVFAAICASFLLVAGLFYAQFAQIYDVRVEAQSRLEQKSLSERQAQITQARQIIAQNPWLGVGAGNYTLALKKLDNSAQPIWQYQPVHNVPLLVIAELGIIGFVLMLLSTSTIIHAIWHSHKKHQFAPTCFFGRQIGALMAIAMIATSSLLDHWQWDSHIGILLLAAFGAIFVVGKK